jgi:DNA primase
MVAEAVDPLEFVLERAAERFDFDSPEGARQAARRVLEVLARVPRTNRAGLDLKVAKALDTLGRRLGLPVADLKRQLRQLRRPLPSGATPTGEPGAAPSVSESMGQTIHISDLDPLDRELVQVVLNEPAAVAALARRVPAGSLKDAPLRAILQTCYDLQGEGLDPSFDRVAFRLSAAERALAAGLLLPAEPAPLTERARPASWPARLAGVLNRLEARAYQERLRDLQAALAESDPTGLPDEHRALRAEYFRLLTQRPDPKAYTAS